MDKSEKKFESELDEIIKIRDRTALIKDMSPDNLCVVRGAQDFKNEKAFVAVGIPTLSGEEGYSIRNFLITSDKKKIILNKDSLFEAKIVVQKFPSLVKRWEPSDLEEFLNTETKTSLQELFLEIRDGSRLYLDFSNDEMHSMVSLWIIGTYFHRMFASYPYIHLNGNAGSGKTKCLLLIATLSFNGELSVNNTPSYMVRITDANLATACIDEVEKFNKPKDEETKTILAMLNAGYKRGSTIGKSEQGGKGNKWKPTRFEAYSPKVLAGISSLQDTLASRCIPLIMIKSGNKDLINRELNEESNEWQSIRNKLYRSCLEHFNLISQNYQEIKDSEILGRAWELWKPLFSVARAISKELYQEIRMLALEIEQSKKEIESENTTTPILLNGLLSLKETWPEKSFFSVEEMINFLKSYDEEFKWITDDTKINKGRWLGGQLRRAGVITGRLPQQKVNGQNQKGCIIKPELIEQLLKNFGTNLSETEHELPVEANQAPEPDIGLQDLPF